ncbi:DUF3298 and DUF4163 domain-containing protein [Clostridium oryzae]|uniref:Anti-sigma-V factor RsiV n=1 Tax=Clostridium oryzae TaxID=1450648 RepID=A0A1V4IJA1_9CLOT|nr:DUF3298 and DUF4163 domain-containing protein [Clostridium oryzae]OPJ59587.1 anti-sigma-V factor RsiV [Clostridium oryzae]
MKMKLTKVSTAIIAFQVTAVSLGIGINNTTAYAAVKPVIKVSTVQSKANNIKVTTKTIKYSDKYIESKLEIPVFSGIKNKKVENKINSKIKNSMVNFKEAMHKQAKKDITALIKDGQKNWNKYGAYTGYSVKEKTNKLLSFTADYYSYMGGAHGSTDRRGINHDLSTGKLISLSSIFQKGFDYKTTLKKAVKDYVKKNPDMVFEDAAKSIKDVTKNRQFYIKDGKLVLIFQQYEIGPYAAGIQEVKIPLKNLKLSKSFKALL